MPTAYGLPSETVTYGYDSWGQPSTMGGRSSYVAQSVYSPYGELLQLTEGTISGKLAYQTWYLDEGTRRLTRNVVSDQAVAGSIVDANYTYDQSGNVTRLADNAGTPDIQCLTYDYLQQVKEAWTIGAGTCGTPSTTVMGGPAPYWNSYTYDAIGNRTKLVKHPKTGSATTATYTYPTSGATAYPDAATGKGGPHAVSSVSTQVGTATPTVTNYKYDATGNTTTRGTQALTWDSEGELTTVKAGTAAASTYLEDGDGERILRTDADGTKTLYLDSTEIKLTGTTKTSQRWYQFNGRTIATRTSAGVQVLAADNHGTGEVQIDTGTAAYNKRRFDMFGAARTGTGAGAWLGDHGFLDKSVDLTGLTAIGARYYDNQLGRFVSVDPLLDPDDPMQANGYAYANSNPVSMSDPSGEMLVEDSYGGPGRGNTSGPRNRPHHASPPSTRRPPSVSSPHKLQTLVNWKPSRLDLFGFVVAGVEDVTAHVVRKVSHFLHTITTSNRRAERAALLGARESLKRARVGYRGGKTIAKAKDAVRLGGRFETGLKVGGRSLAVIGAAISYTEYREHDDVTTSVLKAGIETGGAVAGASLAAGACGLVSFGAASALCAAGGGYIGSKAGRWATNHYDKQITATAGKIDDFGHWVGGLF